MFMPPHPSYPVGVSAISPEPVVPPRRTPLRVLVVCPSWVGDVVMATPALRLIRSRLRGSFIGLLVRPGLDEVLAGSDLFDEIHVDRARGIMGPKRVAARIRPRRYDAALLLTNSFSTALITRLAFIPRRVGYDRDARGMLLTDRVPILSRSQHGVAAPASERLASCVPMVDYYLHAARRLLDIGHEPHLEPIPTLTLAITPEQDEAALALLAARGVAAHEPFAVLNPGANNEAKRWPAARFAALADHLVSTHGLRVLVNGAPNEAELVAQVVNGVPSACRDRVASLTANNDDAGAADGGVTLSSLKGVLKRAKLMVTNDTGPRHIALAFGVPTVSLFGPTDPRWTTPPESARAIERVLVADPTLPMGELADDHPQRCAIDKISLERVESSVASLLGSA